MQFKKSYFLLVFILQFIGSDIIAQKKRILLVPFDQFQFESPTPTEEIADFNDWKDANAVYEEYNKAIISFLNNGQDSLLFFHPSDNDLDWINRVSPRIYKKDPVSHFGVEVEALMTDNKLSMLLENMAADYILFITRYKIVTKLISSRASVATSGKFIAWATHYVDYEIYNKEGNLVAGSDRYPLNPHNPTSKTYLTEGTLVKDLERPMKKLIVDIDHKINRYESKGKVIFKNKTK